MCPLFTTCPDNDRFFLQESVRYLTPDAFEHLPANASHALWLDWQTHYQPAIDVDQGIDLPAGSSTRENDTRPFGLARPGQHREPAWNNVTGMHLVAQILPAQRQLSQSPACSSRKCKHLICRHALDEAVTNHHPVSIRVLD